MYKLPVIVLLLITAINAAAQVNVNDALSRMETAINDSQEEFSMQDIYFMGRAAAAHLLNNYRLYTENPAMTVYVNLICDALAVNSTNPNWYDGYYVMILDTPVINAFATPGGHIFLTRGILEIVTSEDMLAAIIAHEMAHIQLQHGVAIIKHSKLVQNLSGEQQRLNQSLDSGSRLQLFSAAVGEFVQSMFSGGYSQLQEFEADSTGFNMLVSAGYNGESMIELMRILGRLQGDQRGSLNSTHPLPIQRIDNLKRQNTPVNMSSGNPVRKNRFLKVMGKGNR